MRKLSREAKIFAGVVAGSLVAGGAAEGLAENGSGDEPPGHGPQQTTVDTRPRGGSAFGKTVKPAPESGRSTSEGPITESPGPEPELINYVGALLEAGEDFAVGLVGAYAAGFKKAAERDAERLGEETYDESVSLLAAPTTREPSAEEVALAATASAIHCDGSALRSAQEGGAASVLPVLRSKEFDPSTEANLMSETQLAFLRFAADWLDYFVHVVAQVRNSEATEWGSAARDRLQAAEREVAQNAPDVIDQIRGLAKLRDDGILTGYEFEAKKAELLLRI